MSDRTTRFTVNGLPGLLILALWGAPGIGSARENRNVQFRHIGPDQGLAEALVTTMIQDRDGFMWFGTQEGLHRFDGYSFTRFVHAAGDSSSLSHNAIRSIVEDREGVLWIGTDGGGLNRFDPRRGTFRRFQHDPHDPSSLSDDRVRVVYEDRLGTLWIGTDGGGINRFDPATQAFVRHARSDENPNGLSNDHVRAVLQDEEGRLWIGTEGGGLNLLEPQTGLFAHFRHDPGDPSSLTSDRVMTLLQDTAGVLWIGTDGGGLDRFDASTRRFEHFKNDSDGGFSADSVRVLCQDRDGVLWIGTDRGLYELFESGELRHHRNDPTDPHSLSHDRVVSIVQDRGDVLWVGTYAGLNKWNTNTGSFLHYTNVAGELSNGFVTSFAEDPDGTIWIGTHGGGLNRFNRISNAFTHYHNDPNDVTSLSDDRVMSLLVDRAGRLWVGTIGGGLNRFHRDTEAFARYRHDASDPTSLSANGVTAIYEDRRGELWIATYRGGLNRFDPAAASVVRYRHNRHDTSSLSSDRVVTLLEDKLGALWIGTDDGGLNHLDRRTGKFVHYRHTEGDKKGLSSDHVWSLAEDESGNLWIGTAGGGLNRWSFEDRQAGREVFQRYGHELLSQVVNAMQWDDQGKLWLSTNHGLARFDPRTERFTTFNPSHGLQSYEFNFGASVGTRDGAMFFGGLNGFNAFYPHRVLDNPYRPPVWITRILKANEPIDLGGPTARIKDLALGHEDSVVAFEFAALDYTSPDQNLYSYQLEGFDVGWQKAHRHRRATYTNLPAGEYVFRVRGSNNDGVWNDEGTALAFRVLPPPWRTWWAHSLYLLAAATGLALYVRARRRDRQRAVLLARTNENLRSEVKQRTRNELALQREKEKAQRYLDVAEVIMVVIDRQGIVTLINQKGCRVLGCGEEDIVGKNWFDHFVLPQQRKKVWRLLHNQDSPQYSEYSVVTRQGDERIIAWRTAFLAAEDGAPAGSLSSGTDITPMLRLEEQKHSAENASQAKSQTLANTSHEIRTPMNGVLGMLELLLDCELSGQERRYAETAHRAANDLLGILNDILDFSKIEAGELEIETVSFDLQQVVENVVELFGARAREKGLDLSCAVSHDLPPAVDGDPTRVRQILANLVGNAVKFTDNGKVSVLAFAQAFEEDSVRIHFEVRDTGIGLSQDAKQDLFAPFKQADSSTAGTGLGLSIARQLTEKMGGQIGVRCHQGMGSTFWVELPFRIGNEGEAAPSKEVAQPRVDTSGVAGLIVLVVEDNPINREVARNMLRTLGCKVDVVENGAEAVEAVQGNPYDLVLMDCQMPVMDGYEATRVIREYEKQRPAGTRDGSRAHLPIIATTGHAMDGDHNGCLEAGMDDYLSKPFDRQRLLVCIRRWAAGAVAEAL